MNREIAIILGSMRERINHLWGTKVENRVDTANRKNSPPPVLAPATSSSSARPGSSKTGVIARVTIDHPSAIQKPILRRSKLIVIVIIVDWNREQEEPNLIEGLTKGNKQFGCWGCFWTGGWRKRGGREGEDGGGGGGGGRRKKKYFVFILNGTLHRGVKTMMR